jgi:integrase/recombinase XerC
MLLSEGLDRFYTSMEGVLSNRTVVFYSSRLRSLVSELGDRELSTITIDDLRAWRAMLARKTERWGGASKHGVEQGGYSPHTIHQYVRGCRRFFKWLFEEGHIESNPAKRLELPRLPAQYRRGIPDADRDRIIAAASTNARDYAICRLFADSACRLGGMAGLRIRDLHLERRRAVIREKGEKERMIFYSTVTQEALRAWLKVRPVTPKHDALWVGDDGKTLTGNGIYQVLQRLAETCHVDDEWNPHAWRHGAIRGMIKNGMGLAEVSQIAGHSSVKTTADLYGVFSEDELADMMDQYFWIGGQHQRE